MWSSNSVIRSGRHVYKCGYKSKLTNLVLENAFYIRFFVFTIFRMLHNVVMKATFKRAEENDENQACPFYISDKSSFVPPDDIVDMVEKQGTSVVIKKTLNQAEFHALFRDVSKYLPNQPKNNYVVGNPSTLLACSSRVATQNLTARFVAKQPREFSESMACNLPPAELSDFVTKEKTIQDLRKDFTVDGLQTFLMHFLKTYSRTDLPKYIKSEMKLAKKTIKNAIYTMANARTKKMSNWRFFHIDWVFPALGCFNQFYQFSFRNDSEYIFYLLKFRHQQQYGRYPVPAVPFCLSRLVPERDLMIHHLATLDDESDRNTRQYCPKDTKHEEFLMSMRAIAEGAWRGSHHEVLAFATHILCNDDILFHPYWKKYYFFVWGEVAVSLAKLNMPQTFSYSCLEKMKDYAEKCFSFDLDTLLYQQKVASAYGKHEMEELLFERILEHVPKHSCFFRNAIMVHMSCVKKQIEDLLAKSFSFRKQGINTFNSFFGMDVRKNAMVKFEDGIEDLIDKHKLLMHKMCCTFKNEKKRTVFEQQLALMQLYEELLMSIKYQYGSKNKWNLIEASLVLTNAHEKHFATFYNKGHMTDDEYMAKMATIKRELEKQTKVTNHQVWADVCFSHFLMLTVVGFERQHVLDYFYDEAHNIYNFHKHPRALTMKMHLVEHSQYPQDFGNAVEPTIEKNVTIQWLIRNAPNVKQFIRLGISSAERFDLWLSHFEWQAIN
jgi:hypothetical protein